MAGGKIGRGVPTENRRAEENKLPPLPRRTGVGVGGGGGNARSDKGRKRPTSRNATKGRNNLAPLIHKERASYEEILGEIKESIGREVAENPATTFRRTRAGDLLIELTNDESIDVWCTALIQRVGDEMQWTVMGATETLKMRSIDSLTMEDEIKESVATTTGCRPQDVQIIRSFKYPWEERAAIIRAPKESVRRLREQGKLRIGFTCARVVQEGGKDTRPRTRRSNSHRGTPSETEAEAETGEAAEGGQSIGNLGMEIDNAIEQIRGMEEGPEDDDADNESEPASEPTPTREA